MKITKMTNSNGKEVRNQYIIFAADYTAFKSYDSIIVKIAFEDEGRKIYLDKYYWDYSKTTGKYRNLFLNETKKETEKKIKSNEYILTNLN